MQLRVNITRLMMLVKRLKSLKSLKKNLGSSVTMNSKCTLILLKRREKKQIRKMILMMNRIFIK